MRLHQEYFRRHVLKIPVVQHCLHGSVLLRVENKRWFLATIRWVDHAQHPGSYLIEFFVPNHDGATKGKLFSRLPAAEKEWDEYEDYILQWVQDLGDVRVIRGYKEVILATWEMFVLCYDSWLAKQSYDFRHGLLFKTLDQDLPLEQRYTNHQEMLIHLATQYPAVLKTWKFEVLNQVQHYSDWLAELIEKRCLLSK